MRRVNYDVERKEFWVEVAVVDGQPQYAVWDDSGYLIRRPSEQAVPHAEYPPLTGLELHAAFAAAGGYDEQA
jgi:hypothetical protein